MQEAEVKNCDKSLRLLRITHECNDVISSVFSRQEYNISIDLICNK